MPDVIEDYRHLEGLDSGLLQAKYEELKKRLTMLPSGQIDPNAPQDDEVLRELCAVLNQLRRRTAGPPKKKAAGKKGAEVAPSLDDL